jgi:hypothetical protein
MNDIDRYSDRVDEVKLAPLVIKYGARPFPDPSTPEGRHELHMETIIGLIVIICMIGGAVFMPVHG